MMQEQQQAQMAQMASQVAPNAVDAMGNITQEQVKQQAQMEGA